VSGTQSLRIIVTGLIAQHPALGGVAWDYVQYAAGLRLLGHDVYYVEDSGEWPYTLDGGPRGDEWVAHDCSANVAHLACVMRRFGLEGRWAYRFPIEPRWFGMADATRDEVLRTADLLINVSGSLERPWEYSAVGRRVYIDSDPAFTQIKLAAENDSGAFRRRVDAHDRHFTFGECLADAPLPDTGHRWQPTRQPIVLREWADREGDVRPVYTTVMSWTSYPPLTFEGRTYGQKDAEFPPFIPLPGRVAPVRLEIAMGGIQHASWRSNEAEPHDPNPKLRLEAAGWRVVDPMATIAGVDAYRSYLTESKAEWSVAKNGYVEGRTGWFSCRSACYLAAGRPVVVQRTGFERVLPVGTGVVPFSTIDEATGAIADVEARYPQHARAAREIAEAYFDSATVLARLIEDALGTP